MTHERIEFKIRGASKWPIFVVFTLVGALIVIMMIQPMGPVLGITTIAIFFALWSWFLVSSIKTSLNSPRSIAMGEEGVIFITRKNEYRLAWNDISTVYELTVGVPRGRGFNQLTLFSEQLPEISFAEPMLKSKDGVSSVENYARAKAFIARKMPSDRLKMKS